MDVEWLLYGVGWVLGWVLLWSSRRLPEAGSSRPAVAVVVPARDEEDALPHLLDPLIAQLRAGDELVVVDDHSTDATAAVAAAHGATVIEPPELPPGWVGKPHACWHGTRGTAAPILVFLDADVRPGRELLDGLAAAVEDAPEAVSSVQPWHAVATPAERASVLANVVALMGSSGFTVLGRRLPTQVAFGPILAIRRDRYVELGGHAHPDVRARLTEDIALARRAGRSVLFTSRRDAEFRMYPGGLRTTIAGWGRTIADGITATPWWTRLAVAAWVWSLAGGLAAGWPAYPLSAAQVWVLGRRAGRFGPLTAAAYPLAVLALLAMIVRAGWNRIHGGTTWKSRRVPTNG